MIHFDTGFLLEVRFTENGSWDRPIMSGLPTEHVCPVKIESPVIIENRIDSPQLIRSLWTWSLCVEGDEPFSAIVAVLLSTQGTAVTVDNFH